MIDARLGIVVTSFKHRPKQGNFGCPVLTLMRLAKIVILGFL